MKVTNMKELERALGCLEIGTEHSLVLTNRRNPTIVNNEKIQVVSEFEIAITNGMGAKTTKEFGEVVEDLYCAMDNFNIEIGN